MLYWRCAPLIAVALVGCGDNRLARGDGGTGDDGGIDDGGIARDAAVGDAGLPDAPPDAPPRCGDGHVDPGEECDGIEGLSGDGCSSACATESITWTNVTPNPIPERSRHAMAYDSVRHRLVVFGGRIDQLGAVTNDTWEWDGTTWTQRLTLITPPARESHAMVFDAARQRIVIFGGAGETSYLNDTWEWDGTTWTQRQPLTSPPPTALHYMAYDATRAMTVMCSDSTWEWDGTTWTQRATSVPATMFETDLVYAGTAGVMLLDRTENWLWNGTAWTEVDFTATVPWDHVLSPVVATYDELRDRVVAIGWHQGPADRMSVWEWNNGNWVQRASTEPWMPWLTQPDVAYDRDHATVWLFGGHIHYWPRDEMWGWNGSRWRQHADAAPPPRSLPMMTYDARRARVVMFGGYGNGPVLADTWEWDGAAWSLRASSGPSPRGGHTLTYDERRGKVIMFGGIDLDHQENASAPVPLSDLWEWDGSSWQEKSVTPSPVGTFSAAVAYDRARGYTLVMTNGQTWTWDGIAWTQLHPAHQPSAMNWGETSMAYDARRGVVVLFARIWNQGFASEAWEWNGIDWIAKGTAPPGYRLFYDPVRARVSLVEYSSPGEQQRFWEWDGVAWTQVTSVVGPFGPAFAFDRANVRWFSFGGDTKWDTGTATSGTNETRELCDGTDADADGLVRCGDPDCWWRCDPLCAPGEAACVANRPRCGDGTCSALESTALCPVDCP